MVLFSSVKTKICGLWRKSQVRVVTVFHALSGFALLLAGMSNDDAVKASIQGIISPRVLGYIALVSAVIIYLASPHPRCEK